MLTPYLPRHPGLRWATLLTLTTVSLAIAGCGSVDAEAITANACTMITDTGSVVVGSGQPGDPAAPEPASGFRLGKTAVTARSILVATAHPLASKAGCEVLKQGGSAVDAAVAVQMVLGLVEPQSSGLGGGAFMLHYDAASGSVVAYDGRETAPAAATENDLRWVSDTDRTAPQPGGARASGRSIGTPGAVRMLELAHQAHGRQPWSQLFDPAITLATDGFPVSGRMAQAIEVNATGLKRDAEATAYFFNADGTPKALGTRLTNPAYAATLNTLARGGANAFYTGPVAQGIVDKIKVTRGGNPAVAITPGLTEMSDLAGYQAKARIPVCTSYRDYEICGMPPPSSGGITVAQIMGIVENFDMAAHRPAAIDIYGGKPTVMGVHLMAEAGRLAYADRNKYIADTDFTPLPGNSWDTMLNMPYLQSRAALISTTRSMGTAQAGVLGSNAFGTSLVNEAGTTHFTIVDRRGNVVSMTTTVEASMGSFHFTQGFILNNQLTDFDASPTDAQGNPIANKLQAGKRPRSSMAPTLVFRKGSGGARGRFVMGTGSPGGATIIQYVAKTLVGALDWGLDAQQATSLVNFGAANSATTNVGGEHPNINIANNGNDDALVSGLRALGHTVSISAQSSGTSTIMRARVNGSRVWQGGADPRREGIVLGDALTP
jgi:gamma-glutamyltranspeptidase/glutathione hydrolase